MRVVKDFRSTATRFVLGVFVLTLVTDFARADLVHDWDLNESQWRESEIVDLAGGKSAKALHPLNPGRTDAPIRTP